uniref:Thioredoxin domain-containing protein n=1 Tax=Caenorhabditis japonica TaxID=281687 RepID=A0A8R1I0U4_CAEJA
MKIFFFLFSLLAITVLAKKEDVKDLSHGYPNAIEWVEFDKAIGIAKDLNKPILFLIHKTWCGACKSLKHELKNSPKTDELILLSRKFVMVNVEDDDEPEDPKYAPDGGYIPRIIFLDTDGNPLKTNNEQKYKNNKYFYPLAAQIIDGMERALLEFGNDDEPSKGEVKAEKKVEKKKEEKKEKKEKKEEKDEKKKEKKDKKDKKEKKDKKDKKAKKEKKEEKKSKKNKKEEL